MTEVIKWFWLKDPSSGLFRLSPRIVMGLAGRRSYSKYLIVCWRKKKKDKKKERKKKMKKKGICQNPEGASWQSFIGILDQ